MGFVWRIGGVLQVGYNGSNDACIGDCKTSTAPLSGAPQSFRNQSYVSFKHACTCWVLSRCPPLFAINHHMLPLPPTDCLKDNPTFDSAGWSAVELNLYGCSLILLPRRGDYVHQQLPQMWVRERTALPGRTLKYLTSASTLH